MRLFGPQLARPVHIIFDVGSGSIGGAIVMLDDGSGKPRVLFSTRHNLEADATFSFEAFFRRMARTHGTVTNEIGRELSRVSQAAGESIWRGSRPLHAETPLAFSGVDIFFSAPWYTTRSYHIDLESETPRPVTSVLLQSMLSDAAAALREEMSRADMKIFEQSIMGVELNGYQTLTPLNSAARSVTVHTLTSAISRRTLSAVEAPLRTHFNNREITKHSFAKATYTVLRDLFPKEENWFSVDISGEMTEVVEVQGGVVHRLSTFPIGRHTLTRIIMQLNQATCSEAESVLVAYFTGHLEVKLAEKIRGEFERIAVEWRSYFDRIVPAGKAETLPVYVMADQLIGEWFTSALARGRNLEKIAFFDDVTLSHHVVADNPRYLDHFLALETLYVRRVHTSGQNSVL